MSIRVREDQKDDGWTNREILMEEEGLAAITPNKNGTKMHGC